MNGIVKLITLMLVLAGCTDESLRFAERNGDSTVNSTSESTGHPLVPELRSVDSLEIFFYADTANDPARNSRFFSYTSTADTAKIVLLTAALSAPVERLSTVKPCHSQGKIHTHRGGRPVKTVYFSTADGACSYLYFIHNGDFCYAPMPAEVAGLLSNEKLIAKAP